MRFEYARVEIRDELGRTHVYELETHPDFELSGQISTDRDVVETTPEDGSLSFRTFGPGQHTRVSVSLSGLMKQGIEKTS